MDNSLALLTISRFCNITRTFIIVFLLWLLRILIHILRTLLTHFWNNNHLFSFLTMLTLRTLTTHFINIITKRSYSINYWWIYEHISLVFRQIHSNLDSWPTIVLMPFQPFSRDSTLTSNRLLQYDNICSVHIMKGMHFVGSQLHYLYYFNTNPNLSSLLITNNRVDKYF